MGQSTLMKVDTYGHAMTLISAAQQMFSTGEEKSRTKHRRELKMLNAVNHERLTKRIENYQMSEPYFLEVDDNGCCKCGAGRTWTIVRPDGVAMGRSWSDDEEASYICELLNDAYERARGANSV